MAKKKANAITRLQKFLAAIAGDTTAPEPVTNEEKLLYNIAEKANDPTDDKFIVTLMPTSESGGTMDHTNAEILDAYMAGKTIMFDIALGDISTRVQATLAASFDNVTYPSFNALGVNADHQLIHLYVDPSSSESNTFTMQVEDLGGGGGTEFLFVNVANNGSVQYDDTDGNINEQFDAGKRIIVNRTALAWREGGGGYYTYYCHYANFLLPLNRMSAVSVAFNGTVASGGQGTYSEKEYDLSSLVVEP